MVLKAMGQTLNVMTLGGLALSIGVLVDNAIVVIEVIMQKRSQGMSPREASSVGAKEVAMPVLASTVSTLIVFFPVVFLKGVVKILFSALSIAVIAAMVTSYFAAMMVIPLYTAHFLSKEDVAPEGILGWIQHLVVRITDAYGRSLRRVVAKRKVVLPVSVLLLLIIGGLFGHRNGRSPELFTSERRNSPYSPSTSRSVGPRRPHHRLRRGAGHRSVRR